MDNVFEGICDGIRVGTPGVGGGGGGCGGAVAVDGAFVVGI